MKKLKIGLFLDNYFPTEDGVVMVVEHLAKEYQKYADVVVVVPKTGYEEDRGYPIIRVKSMKVPLTAYRLGSPFFEKNDFVQELKKENFDIIHIHSPFAIGKLGLKIGKSLHIPVICTMHTRFDFEFRKYLKNEWMVQKLVKYVARIYEQCDKCIAVNHAMKKVLKDYGYTKDAIVIHNGTEMTLLDHPSLIEKVKKQYQLDRQYTFLFVGRINEVKNIFFLLEVLKRLKQKNISYKMLYVGEGPDEKKLKQKIKEYHLEESVILTGKITDREYLKAIYYVSDLLLFPSLFDASSLVQIEAASQKTPTVFIEGSVTSNTITNNVNGFTALNDVEKYTDRVIEILKDKKLYEKVKEQCYHDLATPWSEIAKETYNLYLNEIHKKETL